MPVRSRRFECKRSIWRNDGAPTGFPSAYFHDPDELAVEAAESGLAVGDVYGVEDPGWLLGDFKEKWADPVMRERLLWLARSVETDPRMRAASAHLLLAASRPDPSCGLSSGMESP